jgi:acyl-CoA dehydrogenase
MSGETEILIATVDRLFGDIAKNAADSRTQIGAPFAWDDIEASGVGLLLVPESAGGFGGKYQDACAVLNRAGWHTLALPIAETLLARALLAGAGIDPPTGPASIAVDERGELGGTAASGFHYTGTLADVPWGASVGHVLFETQQRGEMRLICLAVSDASQRHPAANLAGEPRDRLKFEAAPLRIHGVDDGCAGLPAFASEPHGGLIALAALLRVAQIAGALQWVLQQCIEHSSTRRQFGRSLSQFQVIQHQLALLAEESAAVTCGALAACVAADRGDAQFEIASVKLRANQAIGIATSIAHQVHGAIGVTQEHALQRATRRLWSWRAEFGGERDWALTLGRSIVAAGADRLWPILTARGDRIDAVDSDAT